MQQPRKRNQVYWQSLYQYLWIIATLWGVEIVDRLFFGNGLEGLGLQPGNWSHWEGIFLAPLLHGGWGHLLGNSIGLATLGAIILVRGWQALVRVSIYAIIVGGLFVMLVAGNGSIHIGASGVVYGYWAYIIGLGFYERTGSSILWAIAIIIVYGGFVYGMFPTESNAIAHISWQGHLGGALGGLFAAKQLRKSG